MGGKLMKGTMDMRKIVLLFVLMILISAALPRVSGVRWLADDSPDGTVTEISLNCVLDPRIIKAVIGNINFLFHGTGEDNHRDRYSEPLPSSCLPRRHLADFALPPVLAPPQSPTLAPSPALAPGPAVQTPTFSPSQTPIISPSPSPDPSKTGLSPSPPSIDRLPSTSGAPVPVKGEVLPPEKHKTTKKTVLIAVLLTALGTTALILLIVYFCGCCRKAGYGGNRPKDDRPFMRMTRSEYSGSSCNSGHVSPNRTEQVGSVFAAKTGSGLGSSNRMEQVGSMFAKTGSGLNGHNINSNSHSVISNGPGEYQASGTGHGIISNGPGEYQASGKVQGTPTPVDPSLASLPPLKPPPGRTVAAPPPAPPLPPRPSFPPAPPPLPKLKPSPPPPPPLKSVAPPRPPPAGPSNPKLVRPPPLGKGHSSDADADDEPKSKLKPLFWDKVSTNPDKSMVWNEIKSGSFQFNEEMIEKLFGMRTDDKRKFEGANKGSSMSDQYIMLLDPKKSQNLAISLKAMGLKGDEVCEALTEGEEIPSELLQTLLKLAPTTDEELKIRLYTGDPSLLGPGEQFIKALMSIPFAFKRMDAMLFMSSVREEDTSLKESFASIEVACKELRSSRLFLKILEAVLKLGNRMNKGTFRGGAQAFKLDTLLKLSDVKGTDGKTTLLHFVVKEIIQSEGVRAVRISKDDPNIDSLENTEENYQSLGLNIVSSLSTELENVKRAAGLDADVLTHTVSEMGHKLVETKEFLNNEMKNTMEDRGFHRSLRSFVEQAETEVAFLLEEEKRIRALVKSTTDYFHGNSGRDEGLRLFVIVRDFLAMIDRACREVRESQKKVVIVTRSKDSPASPPSSLAETRQNLFPAIRERRSSSDEDGDGGGDDDDDESYDFK